jgi:hypothetical protein
LACVKLDGKHSRPEFLNNFSHDFNSIFFWQFISPVRFRLRTGMKRQ